MNATRTLARTAGLALLALLVAVPVLADGRERRHDGGRHYREDGGRHWQHGRRYADRVPPWLRGPRLHGQHRRDWHDWRRHRHWRDGRGHYRGWHHDQRHHRFLVDPSGRFFFRMF
ncbi:MAG TPA: hypothetical protein VNS22_18635 [Geminicoccus sp.]|uniref:hypothetical protein n=1 Tax=Geminicoccus sp. TaxID=2024832 RepID=UPI002C4A56A0|nr:hypothetical protein [Geminicoccus sp.]HWL70379.1 hypothetical protein [Geminicoccus sp.]